MQVSLIIRNFHVECPMILGQKHSRVFKTKYPRLDKRHVSILGLFGISHRLIMILLTCYAGHLGQILWWQDYHLHLLNYQYCCACKGGSSL